jgi:RNA polymerase sigma factor (sigma-70 family)
MIRDLAKKGYKEAVKEKLSKEDKLLEKKELSEDEFKQAVAKIKKIVSASALMYLLSLEEMATRTEVTVAGEKGPVEELEFSELKQKLDKSLEKLPPLQRKVAHLFFHQGLKQKEIAKKLDLSKPKVCRLIDRATRRLQQELK